MTFDYTRHTGFIENASTWADLSDGDSFSSTNWIACDSNYHLNENVTSFVCGCEKDGASCETIEDACVIDSCTLPGIANGSWASYYSHDGDVHNGTLLNATNIVCDANHERTSQAVFVCICMGHGEACEFIDDACVYVPGVTTAPGSDDSGNDDGPEDDDEDDTSSKSVGGENKDLPEWALILIIVGDVIACVLLGLGIWACYDYRTSKRAEKYWNAYHEHREKNMTATPPVALEVGSVVVHKGNDDVDDAILRKGMTGSSSPITTTRDAVPVGQIVSPSPHHALLSKSEKLAAEAEERERRGDKKEAARLYKSASMTLNSVVKDMGVTTDESFGLAVRAGTYQDRAESLEKGA